MNMREIAIRGLEAAFAAFEKDLEALPTDAFDRSFGGKSRTVADIVYELCLVNDHICRTLKDEPPVGWPDGWIHAPEQLRSREASLQAFREMVANVMSTVEPYAEADFAAKVMTEQGETDRFERCRFMAMHVWYHSGQLNYIQTMLGDDGWHW